MYKKLNQFLLAQYGRQIEYSYAIVAQKTVPSTAAGVN